jgi:hypothetical protein
MKEYKGYLQQSMQLCESGENLETFQQGIDDATTPCALNVGYLASTNRTNRVENSEAQERADEACTPSVIFSNIQLSIGKNHITSN